MSIAVGQNVPSVPVFTIGENGPEKFDFAEYCAGAKVVLFSVPGAYTPTCSAKHLPGFVERSDAVKAKGIDKVACIAVNDPFVMKAWGQDNQAAGKVDMLSDGNAELAKAMGLEMDASGAGLGLRSKRYAMVIENGVVTSLHIDGPGVFEETSVEAVLERL